MKCLDTCFIIDFLKNKQNAVEKAKEIASDNLFTTSINVFEFLYGSLIKPEVNQKDIEKLKSFLESIGVLAMDNESAEEAAKIAANLKKEGKIIELSDSMIAGIMKKNNCFEIVTNNVDHYSRIKGIKVINY